MAYTVVLAAYRTFRVHVVVLVFSCDGMHCLKFDVSNCFHVRRLTRIRCLRQANSGWRTSFLNVKVLCPMWSDSNQSQPKSSPSQSEARLKLNHTMDALLCVRVNIGGKPRAPALSGAVRAKPATNKCTSTRALEHAHTHTGRLTQTDTVTDRHRHRHRHRHRQTQKRKTDLAEMEFHSRAQNVRIALGAFGRRLATYEHTT